MFNYKLFTAFLFSFCLSTSLSAQESCTIYGSLGKDSGNLLGIDGSSNKIYASFDQTSTTDVCDCGSLRFLEENTNTEMVLSILLTAQVTEQKLRVDLKTAGDCDTAYRAYLRQ